MPKHFFPDIASAHEPLLVDGAVNNIPVLPTEYTAQLPARLQAFLTAVTEAERAFITRSVIYRTGYREALAKTLGGMTTKEVFDEWHRKIGNSSFFLVNQDGDHVNVLHRASKQTTDLGGYVVGMYTSLGNKDRFPNGMAYTHADHVGRLLKVEPDTLVCETGAGLDTDRLNRLNKAITQAGGHLVCHDTTPLLAKVARAQMPHIPYIALPPYPEFLGKALKTFDGRKVMSMKNTLTSLTAEEVEALIEVMETGSVDRCVITQSVGPNIDLFAPQGQAILATQLQRLSYTIAAKQTPYPEDLLITTTMISERAKQIAYTALLEILYQNWCDKAEKRGYTVDSISQSTTESDIKEAEGIAFMNGKGLGPDFADAFKQGLFNEITFTPSAILYANRSSLGRKVLRVRSQQCHLTISKKRTGDKKSAISVGSRLGSGLAIPVYIALKKQAPKLSFARLRLDPQSQKYFDDMAAQVGLAIAFEVAGRLMGIDIVKQYCDSEFEAAMYESMGISIDS